MSISPDDLSISSLDKVNPQYPLVSQDAGIILSDLLWDPLSSSAVSQHQYTSWQHFQLPSDVSSSCQISTNLSASRTCAACSIDPAIRYPPYLREGRPDGVKQNIESCAPPLSVVNYRAAESPLTPKISLDGPIVSSSGRNYPPREKAKKLNGVATLSVLKSGGVTQPTSPARRTH